jgi:hypothetical protein
VYKNLGAAFTTLYFLHNHEKTQEAIVLPYVKEERLLGKHGMAYWAHCQVTKKMKCWEYKPRGSIHNTLFFFLSDKYAQ